MLQVWSYGFGVEGLGFICLGLKVQDLGDRVFAVIFLALCRKARHMHLSTWKYLEGSGDLASLSTYT